MKTETERPDWLLDSEPAEPVTAIVVDKPRTRELSASEKRHELLKSYEDELYMQSMAVVRDALRARDIDPANPQVPADWGDTPEEAAKALRVAVASWQNRKDAPSFIDLASKQLVGIIKARATEGSGPRVLNMTFVSAPKPDIVEEFPELDVTNEGPEK